ncbi:NADH-quinone oxidoreductase subunit C [Paenibacillus radicibacter]|uniref:NADH-quinone oxidoreductase subunit C n=1 Tax=Paenibacillus radicibacter TaxID=2972488 RepID=UPI00280B553B|nr:NADH-quinone oxidoreductase subunit C [Paenibacillus radicibacter]
MSDEQKRDEALTTSQENSDSTGSDTNVENPIESSSESEVSKRSHNGEEAPLNEVSTTEGGQPVAVEELVEIVSQESSEGAEDTSEASPAQAVSEDAPATSVAGEEQEVVSVAIGVQTTADAPMKAPVTAAEAVAQIASAPAPEPGPAKPDVPAGDVEAAAARAAARAARDQARAAKAADAAAEADAAPAAPSPNQPVLDRVVAIIRDAISADAIVDASLNKTDADAPMVVVHSDHWLRTAELLRDHEELELKYLRNLSGVDYGTHLEVVYHLISLEKRIDYTFKVRTDRDNPSIPSVTPIWETANWNEREAYDLLGIDFPGHPALTRIMLSDDWIGHPLRKDYEQYDPEV